MLLFLLFLYSIMSMYFHHKSLFFFFFFKLLIFSFSFSKRKITRVLQNNSKFSLNFHIFLLVQVVNFNLIEIS